MNRRKLMIAIASVVAIAAVLIALVLSRGWIAKQAYDRSGAGLAAKLSPELEKKYAADLRYTLATFWKFHDRGLVSRNDLNDVMEKMKLLRAKKEITEMEIFDFIGYVSRLYTEAIHRNQSERLPE